jgi:ParB family chromosome partitioning protein
MLSPADVVVGGRLRHLDETRVADLVKSAQVLGIRTPISIKTEEGQHKLVTGLHRLEAARRLGRQVPCVEVEGDEIDAQLWEIAENLHRAELGSLDRADHIARWVDLVEERRQIAPAPGEADKPGQVAQVSEGGRGNTGGISAAARELGLERTDVRRAIKVASLTPEAKAAARDAGLDDNRSALLRAANAPAPLQEAVIRKVAAEKATARRERKVSLQPRADFKVPDLSLSFDERLTEPERALLDNLRGLVGEHLAADLDREDPGSVVEILQHVAGEVADGTVSGRQFQYCKAGAA